MFWWICVWVVFVVFSGLMKVFMFFVGWSMIVFMRFCWFVLSRLLKVRFGVWWVVGLFF